MLQQPNSISVQEFTSGMTACLAALDEMPSLKQKEWIRGEPGEDYLANILLSADF